MDIDIKKTNFQVRKYSIDANSNLSKSKQIKLFSHSYRKMEHNSMQNYLVKHYLWIIIALWQLWLWSSKFICLKGGFCFHM